MLFSDNILNDRQNAEYIQLDKGENNINKNSFLNQYNDINNRFNINTTSFISTKDNPNEFETFNFESHSFLRSSKKIEKPLYERETKSMNTYIDEKEKNKISRKNVYENEDKSLHFSFIKRGRTSETNSKSFINNPVRENKYMNIINKKEQNNYEKILNVESFQNFIENNDHFKSEENHFTMNNYSNTYDSNCGKI